MDEIGLEKARETLGEIVNRASLAGDVYTITRHGRPRAVLVGYDWYIESLSALAAAAPGGREARMLAEALDIDGRCQVDRPLVEHYGRVRTDPSTGRRTCDNHWNAR